MGKINDIQIDLDGIHKNPIQEERFYIRPFVDSWLAEVRERGTRQVDVVNAAVGFACLRQLAQKHGAQMLLDLQDGVSSEVPGLSPPFIHQSDDTDVTLSFTNQHYQELVWMQRDRGMSVSTAIHDGLRLMGAMALALPSKANVVISSRTDNAILRRPPPDFLHRLVPVSPDLL